MIHKSFIAILFLAALLTGSLWIASYVQTNPRGGFPLRYGYHHFESYGAMVFFHRGGLNFTYYYPAENPRDQNPNMVGTIRRWIGFLDATSSCGRCGARFRPGEPCPMTNTLFHTGFINYGPARPQRTWDFKVFEWSTVQQGVSRSCRIRFELWFPLLLFAPYPILAFIRGPLRRWRRRRIGHCTKCGYNLHGNESSICPECGTKIIEPSKRATNRVD